MSDHTKCWKHYKVRPPAGVDRPERTKSDFCGWNKAFQQYVFTEAWVDYLTRKLSHSGEHHAVLARLPV